MSEMGGHRIAAGTGRSRKVRPRSSGRPDDKPPRPKKPGGASVARRETRPATATMTPPPLGGTLEMKRATAGGRATSDASSPRDGQVEGSDG